jgi:hypothetical protein
MLIGGVIHDQLGDDAQPEGVCVVEKAAEVVERAVVGMHAEVIGDVVSVVAQGRRVEREQPQGGDAEILQVRQPRAQAVEVAYAVAAAILKGADVELINDRVFVPVQVPPAVSRGGGLVVADPWVIRPSRPT